MVYLTILTYLLPLFPLLTLTTPTPPPQTCSIHHLYTFHTEPIWLENIAVRPTGQLLLTTISQPWIYTFSPLDPSPFPRIVAELPQGNGCSGITETLEPDVFAVSCATHGPKTFEARGNVVFMLDLRGGGEPVVHTITEIPDAKLLNGMTTSPNGLILMSDSGAGKVWWLNISSGEYGVVIEDDHLLQPGPIIPCGVNGIRIHNQDLLFANSGMGIFGRIHLDEHGNVMGKAEKLVDVPRGVRAFDDFVVDKWGDVWVATHPDAVTVIAEGERWVVKDVGAEGLRAPTSAAMGRGSEEEERIVYVVTGGMGGMEGGARGQIFGIRS